MIRLAENIGRGTVRWVDQLGVAGWLFGESMALLLLGRWRHQPVRGAAIIAEMMQTGVQAVPIATLLSAAVGGMLAIQSLYSLGLFGAESLAHVGIGLAVTREFAPLMIGILVAGRSGSALAARIATMRLNQEVDALKVMGINPVRFLVAPALLALAIMVPALTILSDTVGLLAAGLVVTASLGTTMTSYVANLQEILSVGDVMHGIAKSALFGALIALIAAANGARAAGGAQGVGRMTTAAVVQGISTIIVCDMLFALAVTL